MGNNTKEIRALLTKSVIALIVSAALIWWSFGGALGCFCGDFDFSAIAGWNALAIFGALTVLILLLNLGAGRFFKDNPSRLIKTTKILKIVFETVSIGAGFIMGYLYLKEVGNDFFLKHAPSYHAAMVSYLLFIVLGVHELFKK